MSYLWILPTLFSVGGSISYYFYQLGVEVQERRAITKIYAKLLDDNLPLLRDAIKIILGEKHTTI